MTTSTEEDYLPECWKDDARINSLFAPFRGKDVNPRDWETKHQFWRNCINSWCRSTNRVCFHLNALVGAFHRNGKTPQGIPTVVGEMLREGQLTKTSDLGRLEDGNSWMDWSMNTLVKRPLNWSLTLVNNAVGKKETIDEEYVVSELLKEKGDAILKRFSSSIEFQSTDQVVLLEDLAAMCRDIYCSQSELQVMLLCLRKQRIISIHFDGSMKVIKFRRKNEKVAHPVTEVDLGILKLKKSRECLQNRINKLEDGIHRHLEEIKGQLRQGNRPLAKATLKKKKMAEKVLAKREVALENVESLLTRIQEVESEKMIVEAYRSGVDGFHKTLTESGISLDSVDDTMVAIQEVFDMHEDIQESLSFAVGHDADMAELEAELKDLMVETETHPAGPPHGGEAIPRPVKTPASHTSEVEVDLPPVPVGPVSSLDIREENSQPELVAL